jgi:hypothetical protein
LAKRFGYVIDGHLACVGNLRQSISRVLRMWFKRSSIGTIVLSYFLPLRTTGFAAGEKG